MAGRYPRIAPVDTSQSTGRRAVAALSTRTHRRAEHGRGESVSRGKISLHRWPAVSGRAPSENSKNGAIPACQRAVTSACSWSAAPRRIVALDVPDEQTSTGCRNTECCAIPRHAARRASAPRPPGVGPGTHRAGRASREGGSRRVPPRRCSPETLRDVRPETWAPRSSRRCPATAAIELASRTPIGAATPVLRGRPPICPGNPTFPSPARWASVPQDPPGYVPGTRTTIGRPPSASGIVVEVPPERQSKSPARGADSPGPRHLRNRPHRRRAWRRERPVRGPALPQLREPPVPAGSPIPGDLQAHLACRSRGGAATGLDARVAAGWDEFHYSERPMCQQFRFASEGRSRSSRLLANARRCASTGSAASAATRS